MERFEWIMFLLGISIALFVLVLVIVRFVIIIIYNILLKTGRRTIVIARRLPNGVYEGTEINLAKDAELIVKQLSAKNNKIYFIIP